MHVSSYTTLHFHLADLQIETNPIACESKTRTLTQCLEYPLPRLKYPGTLKSGGTLNCAQMGEVKTKNQLKYPGTLKVGHGP